MSKDQRRMVTFRTSDELWAAVTARARAEGEGLSDVLEGILSRYLRRSTSRHAPAPMRQRSVRADAAKWQAAMDHAAQLGESLPDELRAALEAYAEGGR